MARTCDESDLWSGNGVLEEHTKDRAMMVLSPAAMAEEFSARQQALPQNREVDDWNVAL